MQLDKITLFFILDTGSPFITTSISQSAKCYKSPKNKFSLDYGFGELEAKLCRGELKSPKSSFRSMVNYFQVSGNHAENIFGLSRQKKECLPDKTCSDNFFRLLDDKYHLSHKFGFIFCKNNNKNYFFLGPLPNILSQQLTFPFKNNKEYSIGVLGIATSFESKRHIAFNKHTRALLDSDTAAQIAIPKKQLTFIKEQILKNTNKHNNALPKEFWDGGVCLEASKIDYSTLPDISFKFEGQNESVHSVKIRPEYYITHRGCGNEVQFSFVDTKKYYSLPDEKVNKLPQVVLGAPFFDSFALEFDTSSKGYLSLRNKKAYCI